MRRAGTIVLAVLILTATAALAEQSVLEFEVAGMSCGRCEVEATRALQKVPGVTQVSVDFASKRARVEANREIQWDEVRKALATLGFEARFPGDPVVRPLTAEERARIDFKIASNGEAIDFRKHLAPGKITIFDFWAEWCGPCHVLTPKLERLVLERPGLALRKVDIKSWDTPVAKQATADFRLAALPYVRIYGPDGKLLGAVIGNEFDKIRTMIESRK